MSSSPRQSLVYILQASSADERYVFDNDVVEYIKDVTLPIEEEDESSENLQPMYECTVFTEEDDFIAAFGHHMRSSTTNRSKEESLTIILDVKCSKAVDFIVSTLQVPRKREVPKIIMFSTLLTWAGKRYNYTIETNNIPLEFTNRVPANDCFDLYATENYFYNFARQHGEGRMFIVTTGLFYGEDGGDLKDILLSIFKEEKVSVFCKDTSLKVPIAHRKQIVEVLKKLLQIDSQMSRTPKSPPPKHSIYIPIVDQCYIEEGSGIGSLIKGSMSKINGQEQEIVTKDLSDTDILTASPATTRLIMLWNLGISFEKNTDYMVEMDYLTNFTEIWERFINVNVLNPVKIFMSGNPSSGKTAISKSLSDALQVEYINLPIALRYVFALDVENVHANDKKGVIATVKEEIIEVLKAHELEAKAKDKKGKKGAAEDEEERVWLIDDLTDEICGTSGPFYKNITLAKKCISILLFTNSICLRKGFIVDIWNIPEMITGVQSLCEICDALIPKEAESSVDDAIHSKGEDCEGQSDQIKGTETSKSTTITTSREAVNSVLELLVELNLSKEKIISKLQETFPPKPSKDDQAKLKALEEVLSVYDANMVEVSIDDKEPQLSDDHANNGEGEENIKMPLKTHKSLIDIKAELEDMNSLSLCTDELSIDEATEVIMKQITSLHYPRIGWLPIVAEATEVDTIKPQSKSERLPENLEILDKDVVNQNNSSVDDDEKLLSKSEKFQIFLTATVMPFLAKGLVKIRREKPDDPIMYLVDYLKEQSSITQAKTKELAEQKFQSLLKC